MKQLGNQLFSIKFLQDRFHWTLNDSLKTTWDKCDEYLTTISLQLEIYVGVLIVIQIFFIP